MSDWRRRWQRYRRQNRVLVGLYVGLLLLTAAGFALFNRLSGLPPEELTNRLLIFLLWWFDLTLIAIVGFIILRNLLRLALERRFGFLGARFRTKLLLSYVVLSLAPTVVLFMLGASLLSKAAASWFAAPVEGMVAASVQLAEGVRQLAEARTARAAEVVARRLVEIGDEAGRVAELERLHTLLGNHLTMLYRNGVQVVELVDPRQRPMLRLPPLEDAALRSSGLRGERYAGTVVVRAWQVLPDGGVVVVGEVLPTAMIKAQGRLATSSAAYERLKLERPTITATAVLGFGGLALLVAFAAIWLGLYLSRRFTAPLLALAATARRVAEGDSLEEVPLPAEDEVGLLVDSFNAMARRLHGREEELEAAVRRLRTVLSAIRTGVLTLDAARQTVLANPAAAALLGTPELVDTPQLLEVLAVAFPRLVDTIRTSPSGFRGSLTLYPPGAARHVEVAVVALGTAEHVEGWVVALEDLTQLLRAQRQAAWSEAARRIAHQIKNPLTPIRLAAERIARQCERRSPELPAIVEQGCAAIVEHVLSMQEMVDAFARYAKFPAISRRPVRVGDLVRQLIALYAGVRPDLRIDARDDADNREVLLDPEQIRQALANLVDNAVEASPAGSVVTVRVAWEHDDVVFVVEDEGPGLPVEDPELLFQPFFSTKGRGWGVGLALVQRIASDHGGTVRLEPGRERGVRAVVRIPGVQR